MLGLRYLIPNAITAASMVLGLGSIFESFHGDFQLASWMIVWGVLLDFLDGTTARLLKANSLFGVQFDSFADFVVFGIAPSALIYNCTATLANWQDSTTWLALCCAAYAVATAARLARFNVTVEQLADDVFLGVPCTMVGGMLSTFYLMWSHEGLSELWLAPFPYLGLVCAALMLSPLPFPKLRRRKNSLVNWFVLLNALFVYAVAPLRLFPSYIFFLAMLYPTIGLAWFIWHRVDPMRHSADSTGPA